MSAVTTPETQSETREYETILVAKSAGYATITLNRPDALNAINHQVLKDLLAATAEIEADPTLKATIITGQGKAFAAGADIKEMADFNFSEAFKQNWFSEWTQFTAARKPLISAVNGYALGGGCELAMMTDIVIASTHAKFGQPEINLGVLPGMGGSQRLTLAIGKAKAMDMCLTGRMMDAEEAERSGLVARVVEPDSLMAEAQSIAETIAAKSLIATAMVKEAVQATFEMPLTQGLHFERRLFHGVLSTADQKEGMQAFIEKREPTFTDS